MQTQFEIPKRGITPLGFGDVSVGREMIRVAQEGQKTLSVLLGQWEMIITFFKHGLEVPLCLDPQNEVLHEQHRVILTGAMGMGEVLLAQTKNIEEQELSALGYSKEFLKANVRFLRDTYQQWYAERDSALVEESFAKICDALAQTPDSNS